jgi:hypothetical protein
VGVFSRFLLFLLCLLLQTAATLVNLNGSLAMSTPDETPSSDATIIAAGHSSAVLATILGVGVTSLANLPVYGLTISWALAACASNPKLVLDNKNNDKKSDDDEPSTIFQRGAKVQKLLLTSGSLLCAGASVATWFLNMA